MRHLALLLALCLLNPLSAFADKPASVDGTPPGHARKGGVPPGLAKKGGLPPGLARKFGAAPPARAYIALDPARDDRAWFLIGGQWVMKQNFDSAVRIEVRQALTLPSVPPPVALPSASVAFRVVLFE